MCWGLLEVGGLFEVGIGIVFVDFDDWMDLKEIVGGDLFIEDEELSEGSKEFGPL